MLCCYVYKQRREVDADFPLPGHAMQSLVCFFFSYLAKLPKAVFVFFTVSGKRDGETDGS